MKIRPFRNGYKIVCRRAWFPTKADGTYILGKKYYSLEQDSWRGGVCGGWGISVVDSSLDERRLLDLVTYLLGPA